MYLNKEESNYLNLLRIILIIGVVLTHTTIFVPPPYDFTNISYNFIYFQQEVLGEFRVPTFFILSGYLFFKNSEFNINTYILKIQSKKKSLLLPYIIWSTFAGILHIIYDIIKTGNSKLLNPLEFIKSFFIYTGNTIHPFPINGPLWYVRDLMIIILFSPIIFKIITKIKIRHLIIIHLITFIIIPYAKIPFTLLLNGIIWFTVGAALSLNKKSISVLLNKYSFVFYVYPIFVILNIMTRGEIIHEFIMQCTIILGIIFNAKFWWIILKKHCNINIKSASYVMFLYCSHFIVDYIKPLCTNLLSINNLIILYIIISGTTITICSLLFIFAKNNTKKIFNILVGSRQ